MLTFSKSNLTKCDLRSGKEDYVDARTDERFLRNIEGFLMELVSYVESIDGVSLISDVLTSVQGALRDLTQKSRSARDSLGS